MSNEMPKYSLSGIVRAHIKRAAETQSHGDNGVAVATALRLGLALEAFAAEYQEHLANAFPHRFVLNETPPVAPVAPAVPYKPSAAEVEAQRLHDAEVAAQKARWAEMDRARAEQEADLRRSPVVSSQTAPRGS